MLTVHHLNNSRSQRILFALEELGLPYELVRYQREPTMLAPPALKKVHPLGKSPVLEDNGQKIIESGAILEYLQETYDTEQRLKPLSAEEKIQYRIWLHYAEGSLMPLQAFTRRPVFCASTISFAQPALNYSSADVTFCQKP